LTGVGVGLLGPLIVSAADGETVHLGPRDRVVLAALAAWPGQTSSPERLADALWGDRPPASWSKVVQGCVARIRRGLGWHAVVTVPQGYRLTLPADEVDLSRFERLSGRARELLALGEPDRAAYVIGEALALWRGRALVDLEDWGPARAEAERLEELRRDAQELRLDAELRAGRCRKVLADAQALTAEAPLRERRWALLALAQHQAGARGDALATLRRAREVLVRELGLDPGPDLTVLERGILRDDPGLLVPVGSSEASPTCPYPGLLPYDVGDAEAFFGREADVAACLHLLGAAGVVVVVGPSGSGKSSLVRAGLAAALRQSRRSVSVVTPGAHPMEAFVAAVPSGARPVLVVDQCEEVVALCHDAAEQAEFFTALVDHAARGSLVVAVRSDQLGAVSAHAGFARLVEKGLYLLAAMREPDLRAAIEGPARQAGLLLEPGLVDLLVQDVVGEPAALPLLSHALRQTWHRRESRTLTVSGYRDSGGIHDALTRTAEEIFAGLSERTRDDARQLFLRLVTPGEDGADFRRLASRTELLSLRPYAGEMAATIRAFGDARLLSFDRDPGTRGATVEIAHEALLKQWTRLRVWVDESREDLRIGRRLALAARDWLDSGREVSFLATGIRLDQFTAWRDGSGLAVTTDEHDFLDASCAERVRRQADDRARQDRERALERRALRRLRAVVAMLALAAVVASTLTVLAVTQRRQAQQEAMIAEVRELSAAAVTNLDIDPERSTLLALRAVQLTRSADGSVRPEAREALHRAVVASRVVLDAPAVGGALDWSPAGAVFATEGPEESGMVEIRSATTGKVILAYHGHATDINDVAFSRDGSMLATAGDDGLVKVWNPITGAQLLKVSGPNPQAWKPSFSADGKLLAAIWRVSGSYAGVVRIVDVATGQAREVYAGNPTALAVNGDGTRLAVGTVDPTSIVVLDVRTGRALRTLPQPDCIPSLAWSPDGKWLAGTSFDGTARIWEAASGRLHAPLFGHAGRVMTAAWSPDSTRLATGSLDGTAKLWEVTDSGARQLFTLSSLDLRLGIYDLAFSGDGHRLMASDMEMTATRIWDVGPAGDAEVTNLPADGTWLGKVRFTPDGRGVVAGSAAGAASVWNVATGTESLRVGRAGPSGPRAPDLNLTRGELTLPITGVDGTVAFWDAAGAEPELTIPHAQAVDVSRDGGLLAVADTKGSTRIVDPMGRTLGEVHEAPGFKVVDVRLGPTNRHLLATGRVPTDRPTPPNQQVTIWDWTTSAVVQTLATQADTAVFNRAGTRAVTISDQPAVWDVHTGQKIAALAGQAGKVLDAEFNPDGSLIATAGFDGTIRLWDARSGLESLALYGHHASATGVAFSPDGSRLASVGLDGALRIWELNLDRLVEIAKHKLTRPLTADECRQYLHRDHCDG
jgi:WD40 repeat protein/DNA-binding SARP family transcriptional activator